MGSGINTVHTTALAILWLAGIAMLALGVYVLRYGLDENDKALRLANLLRGKQPDPCEHCEQGAPSVRIRVRLDGHEPDEVINVSAARLHYQALMSGAGYGSESWHELIRTVDGLYVEVLPIREPISELAPADAS